MKWDINVIAALSVMVLGVVLLLGYLGVTAGAQWTTVQSLVVPFAILITLAIIILAIAFRRD